ncbi:MAG: indole-3-glycerol phosphate synthase TrpC [Dehalococcoidales bacterium]|nr:indole-3-glycerol phosphate synthase TrpC [Dehalococcoidales bacterium]
MTILDKIIEDKRQEVTGLKQSSPQSVLEEMIEQRMPVRGFAGALATPGISLIAEAKKASPSRGLLCPDFDAVRLARTYEESGAAAISVLTESKYFQGRLDYLTAVKGAVDIPVLRKDFIFDPYQVYESAAAGADAILLIVAVLTDGQLDELQSLANDLGLACLVEVHDESEVERAVGAGVRIIGINNRDLVTFDVDITTTGRLRPLIPEGPITVSESGIRTRDDMTLLQGYGVDAILVGESLVTSENIPQTIKELLS